MGSGLSHLFPCLDPAAAANRSGRRHHPADPANNVIFAASEPLDETLGHSFCYVRSSAHFLSPTPSDRFLSPSHSLRFSPSHEPGPGPKPEGTGFKAISGASVSANTSTPRTVLQLDNIYDSIVSSSGFGFESTSSFCALPLQPVPRDGPPLDRAFFMSGPIERGALSGPLDHTSSVPFSAPLGGAGYPKRRRKTGIRKAFSRNLEKKRWVVPVRNFVGGRKDAAPDCESNRENNNNNGNSNNNNNNNSSSSNVQWALGKAGEKEEAMEYWQRAKAFAEEAAKKTQQTLTTPPAKIADIVCCCCRPICIA